MNKKKNRILAVFISALLVSVFILFALSCSGGNPSDENTNQEYGVDEPDIVRVTADGHIIKAQTDGVTVTNTDKGNMKLIKVFRNPAITPIELILYNNYFVFIANKSIDSFEEVVYKDKDGYLKSYNRSIQIDNTVVYIFNMDNFSQSGDALIPERNLEFFGSYYSCRIFEGNLFVVINATIYNALIIGELVNSPLTYYDSASSKNSITQTSTLDVSNIERITTMNYSAATIIAKLDLNTATAELKTSAILCNADVIVDTLYFSPHAIYPLITNRRRYSSDGCYSSDRFRYFYFIIKISVDTLEKQAEVELDDLIKDRYCMYDNGTNLFIVEKLISPSLVVYDNQLRKISVVNEIAPNEQVKSVRFDERYCYVVTFRNVDPLFKIDISNSYRPKIIGELKIDGFSSNLIAFGENRMIGIGYENNNVKVSFFDTSEDAVREINSLLLEGRYAEAAENKKAVFCDPELNVFAFSVKNYYYQSANTNSAYFFGINETSGELEIIGQIDTRVYNEREYFKRVYIIDGYIYVTADSYTSSYNIEGELIQTLDTDLSTNLSNQH